jgi:hypothetical protein
VRDNTHGISGSDERRSPPEKDGWSFRQNEHQTGKHAPRRGKSRLGRGGAVIDIISLEQAFTRWSEMDNVSRPSRRVFSSILFPASRSCLHPLPGGNALTVAGSNPRMQVISNFQQLDPRRFVFTTTVSF